MKSSLSVLVLIAASAAFAQGADVRSPPEAEREAEADPEAPDDEPSVDEDDATEAPSADPDRAAGPASTSEETVFVVQGKPFLIAGKLEVAPQVVQSVNDSFTSHTGLLASGIYHLKENVAFEVTAGLFGWWDEAGLRLGGRDSELTTELRLKESLAPERVKLYQFPWVIAADAQWSPLYGKVSIQDLVLGQFSLYLSVGAGVFGLQLEKTAQNGNTKSYVELPQTFGALPAMSASATFGGGLRFYFTEWLGVRFEVRDYVIPLAARDTDIADADISTFDVTNLVLGQLGVSFVF